MSSLDKDLYTLGAFWSRRIDESRIDEVITDLISDPARGLDGQTLATLLGVMLVALIGRDISYMVLAEICRMRARDRKLLCLEQGFTHTI